MSAPRVRRGCARLLTLGSHLADRRDEEVQQLSALLLAMGSAGTGPSGGHSELNADGSPLQLCVTVSEKSAHPRLIGDPAWFLASPEARLAASVAALDASFAAAGARQLAPMAQTLLAHMLPPPGEPLDAYQRGVAWLSVALDGPGAALYVDTQPLGARHGWTRAAKWLEQILPQTSAARPIVEHLAEIANLASVGIEGVDARNGRAKLYWRPRRPLPLDRFGIEELTDPSLVAFLRQAIGGREMRLSGLVMSAGFSLSTGALTDVKVDLCAHCVPRPAAEWIALIEDWSAICGGTPPAIAAPLRDGECEVANLGLGIDRDGKRRLNIYLKPPGIGAVQTADEFRTRLASAVDHLIDLQDEDGAWSDYRLPVGEAKHWVTAFLAVALAEAADAAGRPEARDCAVRAARWLDQHRAAVAGWGYNETTPVDADTTGFALRLNKALGATPRRADIDCLREHWRPGGGFATFQAPDHWADVHPCVTAAAFNGLPETEQHALIPELVDYLRRTARPDGTWPAYWWRNHLYSTWHHLRLIRRLGLDGEFRLPAPIDLADTPSCFELAYAAGIECFRGDREAASKHLSPLFDRQRVDGGWPGGSNLRVTDPSCARPWETPRGDLYTDRLGTISTASAVMVMTEMLGG